MVVVGPLELVLDDHDATAGITQKEVERVTADRVLALL